MTEKELLNKITPWLEDFKNLPESYPIQALKNRAKGFLQEIDPENSDVKKWNDFCDQYLNGFDDDERKVLYKNLKKKDLILTEKVSESIFRMGAVEALTKAKTKLFEPSNVRDVLNVMIGDYLESRSDDT